MSHIAEDEFVPGNLLFADGSALKTTDGTTTSLITGSSTSYGYIDGVGANAKFNHILSFVLLSRSNVILADYHNHCLRSVDRLTNQTSTYSGNCTNRGYQDGVDALFTFPYSIILDYMNSQQLIISEHSLHALKTINVVNKNVITMFRYSAYDLNYLLQDPETGNIYVTFNHGVGLYIYQSNTFSIITGSTSSGFVEGELSQLRIEYPAGLAFLSRGTLLVADMNNNGLRVLDLTTNSSSSICTGVGGHSDGDASSCQLTQPWSLLKENDIVFISGTKYIRSMMRGRYPSETW